ncbi:CinA family protein [Maricaulis sp.]|uniref:CinA family protein n=1 Tax=Maricaulis sp. TaxID=1486257 RepID=UPI001B0C499C|nr:CinA family protein [Maricaulis sp.]
MMFDTELITRADALLARARTAGVMITTAESCTGGLVSSLMTDVEGSSDVVDRTFVTYSNEAKTEMLGIPARVIVSNGAVSREVARRMAEGALLKSNADIAVSITGIAGPGGTAHKPAGLVHFGLAIRGRTVISQVERFGDRGRGEVRRCAVLTALGLLDQGVDFFG